MVHELTLKILGTLPDYSFWIYSAFDFLLACIFIILVISPFIFLIKLLGGK